MLFKWNSLTKMQCLYTVYFFISEININYLPLNKQQYVGQDAKIRFDRHQIWFQYTWKYSVCRLLTQNAHCTFNRPYFSNSVHFNLSFFLRSILYCVINKRLAFLTKIAKITFHLFLCPMFSLMNIMSNYIYLNCLITQYKIRQIYCTSVWWTNSLSVCSLPISAKSPEKL